MLFKTRLVFLLYLFLGTFTLTAQVSSISTFVYHRFGDDRFPSTNIKLEQFEAHLKYLKDNDYDVLTLSEALKRLEQDSFQRTAVLTIDDGYKTFFENALPLLKKYGFTATLFVNTETIGGSDYMDWQQIKSAQQAGIEIGNHSHSHAYFLNGIQQQFEEDLATSEELFTTNLGEKPQVYAYPYGEWNIEMVELIESKGYLGAVAQNSGVLYKEAPQFHLPRFPMSEAYAKLEDFISKLNTLPLRVSKSETKAINNAKPSINLEFQQENLNIDQLQCFVQGAECQKSMQLAAEGIVKLNVRPDRDLKRRRTLFTITIPDNNGKWHWFSYLWVIPSIEE
ncbi:MAG: polysaccharide deacetylase family protein [Cytophagia bacterium]|nr:polysaccharide deacetylase family protein [Cytophagia bacterium]